MESRCEEIGEGQDEVDYQLQMEVNKLNKKSGIQNENDNDSKMGENIWIDEWIHREIDR